MESCPFCWNQSFWRLLPLSCFLFLRTTGWWDSESLWKKWIVKVFKWRVGVESRGLTPSHSSHCPLQTGKTLVPVQTSSFPFFGSKYNIRKWKKNKTKLYFQSLPNAFSVKLRPEFTWIRCFIFSRKETLWAKFYKFK